METKMMNVDDVQKIVEYVAEHEGECSVGDLKVKFPCIANIEKLVEILAEGVRQGDSWVLRHEEGKLWLGVSYQLGIDPGPATAQDLVSSVESKVK